MSDGTHHIERQIVSGNPVSFGWCRSVTVCACRAVASCAGTSRPILINP